MRHPLLLLVALGAAGCDQGSSSASVDPLPAPHAAITTTRTISESAPPRHLALVTPRRTVDVKSTGAGLLAELTVSLGAYVQADEPIAVLHNADLRFALELAEATVGSAGARWSEVRHSAEFARDKAKQAAELRDYISGDERHQRRHDAKRAHASAKSARSDLAVEHVRVERLAAQVAALTLRAPFAARVAAVYRSPGQHLLADETVVRLASTEQVIRFAVDAQHIHEFRPGDSVEFVGETDPAVVPAKVTALAPEIDAAGMVIVEATIDQTSSEPTVRTGTRGYVHSTRN